MMPDWLATMIGALVGGLAALGGVWLQIRAQRGADRARRDAERDEAREQERSKRAETLGVALAILDEYAPARVEARLAKGEALHPAEARDAWVPVRDAFAAMVGRDPTVADTLLAVIDAVSAYFDTLPNLSHWVGDEPEVKRLVSVGEAERRFDVARSRLLETVP